MPLTCPLKFQVEETNIRCGEPVTVGLPWPQGAVRDDRFFELRDGQNHIVPIQTRILERWADGSIRWCLFDFRATVNGTHDDYRIVMADTPRADSAPIQPPAVPPFTIRATVNGQSVEQELRWGDVLESGPLRQRRAFTLPHPSCELSGFIDQYPGLPALRLQLTIRNPKPADHPGGNWDLGNGGSVDVSSLAVRIPLTAPTGRISRDRGLPFETATAIQLTQHSSGGEHWNSSNHIDRNRKIPFSIRGYTGSMDGRAIEGNRATPILVATSAAGQIGITAPLFWENFPKSLSLSATGLEFDLFPRSEELQGGEQKTHSLMLAFGPDGVTADPLVWGRSPLLCHAPPEWYAASEALPHLTPREQDPNGAYLALVDQALEGPDTFLTKRERIDEYGWRHFGDLYGDHEAVKHRGPAPLISHYNNQYDCVAAFLIQFFRSGDRRWLDQGIACADHTCDIDIYHTDRDKPAYNRGLIWHTYHYADADTGTHRSYPKALTRGPVESLTEKMDTLGETAATLKKAYAVGGGPSSSHNYNAGLMLAYYLTGNPLYRDTATDLARFVIDMEDPQRTPFRFLSRTATGLATESGAGGYHGPGRAAGNSILALLVGHRLTGDRAFLDKAEELIRRVVHPNQHLESLDLLNAELRWFYTMTLQALGVYLDHKAERGELDEMFAYVRLTLLHYAEWMARNERPILDTPDRLQYPTETWAAQDMRKVEVFQFAAKHADEPQRSRYLERAEWFFRYVETNLSRFETKSLCRPVILLMKYGWSRNWWRQNPQATAPRPASTKTARDFGTWRMFVPQKTIAIRRAKLLFIAGAAFGFLLLLAGLWWLFS